MSLVEDALKKLRAGAVPEATSGRQAMPAPPPKERPVVVAVASAPAPRRQLGDSSRLLQIDMEALRREHLVPAVEQEHLIAQQFRAVKRPLIKVAFDPAAMAAGTNSRSIMVSSALPGDGKTFNSLNLALSLARERDYSVLLVDGDAAKPNITRSLNLTNRDGLLDLLKDPSRDVESVIVPTSIPGLSILPSGHRSEGVTELLSSSRMRSVVAELEALDPQLLIVVDSPPILLTSEAKVMASLFGQILMVVRAGMTPQHAVTDALKAIGENAPVKLLLNESIHSQVNEYYGYGSSGQPYGDPQP